MKTSKANLSVPRAALGVSPLLSLAQELQDQIWSYVIGHRNIHITFFSSINSLCLSGELWGTGIKPKINILYRRSCSVHAGHPYTHLYPTLNLPLPGVRTERSKLPSSEMCACTCKSNISSQSRTELHIAGDLSLLLVCKQIYAVASRLQFTENRFCFSTALDSLDYYPAFGILHDKLSTNQWSLLRRLDFEMTALSPVDDPNNIMQFWIWASLDRIISGDRQSKAALVKMPGLRFLSLRIRQGFTVDTGDQIAQWENDSGKRAMALMVTLFRQLRHAQLKELRVLIKPEVAWQRRPETSRQLKDDLAQREGTEGLEEKLRVHLLGLDDHEQVGKEET